MRVRSRGQVACHAAASGGWRREGGFRSWREAPAQLMPAADVLSWTSPLEGALPTPGLEATARLVPGPWWPPAVTGRPEIVAEGPDGLSLVPPGDPAAWAGAVGRLLGHDPAMGGSDGPPRPPSALEKRASRAQRDDRPRRGPIQKGRLISRPLLLICVWVALGLLDLYPLGTPRRRCRPGPPL